MRSTLWSWGSKAVGQQPISRALIRSLRWHRSVVENLKFEARSAAQEGRGARGRYGKHGQDQPPCQIRGRAEIRDGAHDDAEQEKGQITEIGIHAMGHEKGKAGGPGHEIGVGQSDRDFPGHGEDKHDRQHELR